MKTEKMYIIRHLPDVCGEIIRARTKLDAVRYAHKLGRMEGEPIWKLMKFSYKATKKQIELFKFHPDTAFAK